MGSRLFIFFIVIFLSACGPQAQDKPQASTEKKLTEKISKTKQAFSHIPHIQVEKLKSLSPKSYQLVDIRENVEREVSVIPNSISLDEFHKKADLLKDKLIIPYCTIGYRSAIVTDSLIKSGFTAKNLEGSVLAWVWSGGNLVDSDGPTKKVHVYGSDWDLLPEPYKAVY